MSAQDEGGRAPLRGDEAELFREFNGQFVRAVQSRTNAPREIVDDACGFAWQQFMRYQPDRNRNWRAWMITTAERETWRLHGIEASHLSLSFDAGGEEPVTWDVPDRRDQVAIRMRLREALGAFSELSDRRRDIKALQVTGFSYTEIGEMRGLTYTRVNRMIAEANAVLREQQGREAVVKVHASPRAARLDELEEKPPNWLEESAIGRRPAAHWRSACRAGLAEGCAGDRRLPARPRAAARRRCARKATERS